MIVDGMVKVKGSEVRGVHHSVFRCSGVMFRCEGSSSAVHQLSMNYCSGFRCRSSQDLRLEVGLFVVGGVLCGVWSACGGWSVRQCGVVHCCI